MIVFLKFSLIFVVSWVFLIWFCSYVWTFPIVLLSSAWLLLCDVNLYLSRLGLVSSILTITFSIYSNGNKMNIIKKALTGGT